MNPEEIGEKMDVELTLREISEREVHRQISELHDAVVFYAGMPFADALQTYRDMVELRGTEKKLAEGD